VRINRECRIVAQTRAIAHAAAPSLPGRKAEERRVVRQRERRRQRCTFPDFACFKKYPGAECYGFVSARPASSAYRRANFASLVRRGLFCSSSANTRSSAA